MEMEAEQANTDTAKEQTVKIGDYTVILKFQGLSDMQENFENLLKWHIENDKE